MSHTIQKLDPRDYRKYGNIWGLDMNHQRTKLWYEQLVSGNREIFVYVEDGDHLGEGAIVFDADDEDYTIAGKRVYISRLVVKREYRNRGIGGVLLDYLIEYARGMGYGEITLGVDISNIGARWLYEKKGFTSTIFVGEDADGKYVKLLKTL